MWSCVSVLDTHQISRIVSMNDTGLTVIKSFKDKETEAAFYGQTAKGFPSAILAVIRRKLRMLRSATRLEDLKVPPNNRCREIEADNIQLVSMIEQDLLQMDRQQRG